jgi:hypothetical protein
MSRERSKQRSIGDLMAVTSRMVGISDLTILCRTHFPVSAYFNHKESMFRWPNALEMSSIQKPLALDLIQKPGEMESECRGSLQERHTTSDPKRQPHRGHFIKKSK